MHAAGSGGEMFTFSYSKPLFMLALFALGNKKDNTVPYVSDIKWV